MDRSISTNKIAQTPKIFLLCTMYYVLCTILIGCATVPTGPPPPPKGMTGIYHRVKKGETLWRISKVYDVELEKISRINRLADTSRIYVGQFIFIPNAFKIAEDLILATDVTNRAEDFIWPLKGEVSSFFGMKRNEVRNKGICIRTREGANISASRSGRVVFCSEGLRSYGKIIIVEHFDGYSTVYAHNAKNLVKLRQPVRQGQVIAQAGSGARNTKPELYFEIRKAHKPQNPFFYLP